MREQRNDPKRLKDILQVIDTIIQYVDGRDMETFLEHTGSGVLCLRGAVFKFKKIH